MKTALIGSKQLGLDALKRLQALSEVTAIITIDDRNDARSRYADFMAARAQVVSTRSEAELAIRQTNADFALVAAWYWLISDQTLQTRRLFGIHHSLLPAYRGGSPLVWALIEGASVVGTSLFELTDRADAGRVWGQAEVATGDGYIGEVSRRCDVAAVELLDALFDPHATPTEQDEGKASWRSQRHPGDGLIDWSLPAIEIQRWIRAQSRPYPGAFTYAGDNRVVIWRASAVEREMPAAAGAVVGRAVACGDGASLLVEESSVEIPDSIVLGPPTTGGAREGSPQ